jgi:hypothetical protein
VVVALWVAAATGFVWFAAWPRPLGAVGFVSGVLAFAALNLTVIRKQRRDTQGTKG